jgi:hypothetical protein
MIITRIITKSIVDFLLVLSLIDFTEISTQVILGIIIVVINMIVLPLVELLLGAIQSGLKHKFPKYADKIDEIFKLATKQVKKNIKDIIDKNKKDGEK